MVMVNIGPEYDDDVAADPDGGGENEHVIIVLMMGEGRISCFAASVQDGTHDG